MAFAGPGTCDPKGGAVNSLTRRRDSTSSVPPFFLKGGQRGRICGSVLDSAEGAFLPGNADSTSVAPMLRSLAIRVKDSDTDVLYAFSSQC